MRNLNRERAEEIRAAMRASDAWERAARLGEKALYMNWAIQLLIDHAAQTTGRPANRVEASRLEVIEVAAWLGSQEAAEELARPENLLALARASSIDLDAG